MGKGPSSTRFSCSASVLSLFHNRRGLKVQCRLGHESVVCLWWYKAASYIRIHVLSCSLLLQSSSAHFLILPTHPNLFWALFQLLYTAHNKAIWESLYFAWKKCPESALQCPAFQAKGLQVAGDAKILAWDIGQLLPVRVDCSEFASLMQYK